MKSNFLKLTLTLAVVLGTTVGAMAQGAVLELQEVQTSQPVLQTKNSAQASNQSVSSQVPQGFNFQAVARGTDGSPLADQNLGVQVQVLKGAEDGTVVYTETHATSTNALGVIQIVIGEGTAAEGQSFSAVTWGEDNYYIKLAVDPAGGTTYEDLGTTRLLSVPYALVAGNVMEGGASEPVTLYNLDTAAGDTSFMVNATGPTGLAAIRSRAETDGVNYGLISTALSNSTNANTMYGVFGTAPGDGTGTQIGVLGSAVNVEATGTNFRYGTYGQARSNGRENIGGFGLGLGDGNGDIVLPGEEVNGYVGSVNAGLIGWAQGNLNYNIGVRGRAYGPNGARANVGVQGTSDATSTGSNIAFDVLVLNSQTRNFGVRGFVGSSPNSTGIELSVGGNTGNNKGLVLYVNRDGNSSIGVESHADTAGLFYGRLVVEDGANINGNLNTQDIFAANINYTGSLNNTSDRNLKENIQPLQNGLSTIMKLNPTTYNFRGNGEYNGLKLATGLHYGLIAQEVEEVLPSLVKDNVHTYTEKVNEGSGPDATVETEVVKSMDYKTMNYTELIPVLIKAVQEQQSEIEKLKKELEALKSEKK